MVGIENISQINETAINNIINVNGISELMININTYIFDGVLFFILLIVLWIILFFSLQDKNEEFIKNLMYSGASVTIISLLLRGVLIYTNGIYKGLLSNVQLWIFPLITIILALFLYMSNKE